MMSEVIINLLTLIGLSLLNRIIHKKYVFPSPPQMKMLVIQIVNYLFLDSLVWGCHEYKDATTDFAASYLFFRERHFSTAIIKERVEEDEIDNIHIDFMCN